MAALEQLAEWHLLLWLVPAGSGILLAAIGRHVGHRLLAGLALVGVLWPLLQSAAAVLFFLLGPTVGYAGLVRVDRLTGPLLSIQFDLGSTGAWAALVLAAACLAAQVFSLAAVARFAGRHRFYALLQLLLASGAVLFTARSPMVVLVGWEGLALSAAFLAGFWESERAGARTGMRWLLFQRTSGLLLMLGLIAMPVDVQLGLWLVVAAAAARAGQLPFHGWLRDSAGAPAPVAALLYGAASTLAVVYLLVRLEDALVAQPAVGDLLGGLGLAGIGLGLLAGLQQYQPVRVLGWLFVLLSAFSLLGFAVADPVAAMLLVTAQVFVLGGLTLAVGTLVGPVAEMRAGRAASGSRWTRRTIAALALGWLLPPGIGFVGFGRLLAAAEAGDWWWPVVVACALAAAGGGWIAVRLQVQLQRPLAAAVPEQRPSLWMGLVPVLCLAVTTALGIAALAVYGWPVVGGETGAAAAAAMAGVGVLGALAGWGLGRRQLAWIGGRLSRPRRLMERVAETGLGIGELMVQLPLWLGRGLGVLIWRVLGDVLIDAVILGTAYKTVEGIGFALRMLQNGRIQRYALVAVATALLLVVAMLR
jgi:NADH:ubiquinone oxidoreductase subunit 5 (subunit L)/multisubunit Na+/H+ antiporter MnhA subunit